ncbi:MAG: restriction endonuclease [Chloroflexota bacterium]
MADLRMTLEVVRSRVEQHSGKGIGEQNTKAVLINPILRALGWDLEDLEEVVLEYKRKAMDNPVDYALMLQRTPRMFIEAKPLDGNLNDPKWVGQIMAYATVAGVQWVALTDGNEYRIYNSHAPVPVEEKLFKKVQLSDDDVAETLQLLSKDRMQQGLIGALWHAHFVDEQVQSGMNRLLKPEPTPGLIRLVRTKAPNLGPAEIRDGLARMQVRFDFPSPPSAPVAPPSSGAPAKFPNKKAPLKVGTPWRDMTMTDLFAEGLLKPPVELKKHYKGKLLTGRIELDGQVSFGGKRYQSLSVAAGQARRTVIGSPQGRVYPQTNGWTFWHFLDYNGRWEELDQLRRRLWAKKQQS